MGEAEEKALHVQKKHLSKREADLYSLSSMLLIASHPASSSPLCLFVFGVLLSSVIFVRSSAGRSLAVLSSCVKLTPLSTRAGCTGLAVVGAAVVAEEGSGGVTVTFLAVAGILSFGIEVAVVAEGFIWSAIRTGVDVTVVITGMARVCGSICGAFSLGSALGIAGRSLLGCLAMERGCFCSSEMFIVAAVIGGDWGMVGSVVVGCLLAARGGYAGAGGWLDGAFFA